MRSRQPEAIEVMAEAARLELRSQPAENKHHASTVLGAVYDFRNTPESGMDMPSLYAAIMDQVVTFDGLG